MKQTRRKELKTNVLSVYLQQIHEAIRSHATYLAGGLVVVAAVLVVGLLVQRNRQRAELAAYNRYVELRDANVATDPTLLDRARALAAEHAADAQLGPLVLQLHGRFAYEKAMVLTAPADRDQRVQLFKDARDVYQRLIAMAGNRRDLTDSARMSLAAVEESMAVLGEPTRDEARNLYQQLASDPTSPYQQTARTLLAEMDDRLAELTIVATRPAEEPPTPPAPTASVEPAAPTQPATEPATAPAVVPASPPAP